LIKSSVALLSLFYMKKVERLILQYKAPPPSQREFQQFQQKLDYLYI
jgi:hypothetical protein